MIGPHVHMGPIKILIIELWAGCDWQEDWKGIQEWSVARGQSKPHLSSTPIMMVVMMMVMMMMMMMMMMAVVMTMNLD